jgi:hypothetical protein
MLAKLCWQRLEIELAHVHTSVLSSILLKYRTLTYNFHIYMHMYVYMCVHTLHSIIHLYNHILSYYTSVIQEYIPIFYLFQNENTILCLNIKGIVNKIVFCVDVLIERDIYNCIIYILIFVNMITSQCANYSPPLI